MLYLSVPGGAVVKNLPASAGDATDTGSIPGSGRCPGGGTGNPLQYSCLEKPMNKAWQATVCGVTKSQTRLIRAEQREHTHMYTLQGAQSLFKAGMPFKTVFRCFN